MKVLGVHVGHDSSAVLVVDGHVVASVQEERFTRAKNDSSFPLEAIAYCLREGGITAEELDVLAIPATTLPLGFEFFFDIPRSCIPATGWRSTVARKLQRRFGRTARNFGLPLYQPQYRLSPSCHIHLCGHHRAHAASAYYTSGDLQERALVVVMDGVGEGVSTSLWLGQRGRLRLLQKWNTEASLGWFYGNATEAMGWRHGSDEWKVMGLAPYGVPSPGALRGFYPEFRDGLLAVPHDYGRYTYWVDHGAVHFHGPDSLGLQPHVERMGRENFASEVQRAAEEQAMNLVLPWLRRENIKKICCAGGFFLNVKFNQRLWYSGEVEHQSIYPNAGDAGLSMGAALAAINATSLDATGLKLSDVYWGPTYNDCDIEGCLRERGLKFERVDDPAPVAASYLQRNLAVGWFQGRMEDGPRALGNRSILMSPLRAENKDLINAKVKYREAFRPFCPAMLAETAHEYLIGARDERFMITAFDVRPEKKSRIPAVVHVDGTARPQFVHRDTNPRYYDLIKEFARLTGESAILNTSFNVKGEPIVCSPRHAVKCFFDTGLDVLILGNCVVEKPALACTAK
jgi:carbamoyltransferase